MFYQRLDVTFARAQRICETDDMIFHAITVYASQLPQHIAHLAHYIKIVYFIEVKEFKYFFQYDVGVIVSDEHLDTNGKLKYNYKCHSAISCKL